MNLKEQYIWKCKDSSSLTFCFKKQGLIIAKLPPSNLDQNSEFKAPPSPHFTGNSACFNVTNFYIDLYGKHPFKQFSHDHYSII